MELELHQLDLRYEALRVRCAKRDRKLLASIGDVGQLIPIVVIEQGDSKRSYIVVEGNARVRALRQLRRDTALAVEWDLAEIDALLLSYSQCSSPGQSVLEEAWLLVELQQRFGLAQTELARRFDRDKSWVSRRLDLAQELPDTVQEEVRRGRIVPHAATKYLLPLARANRSACERLASAVADRGFSIRDVALLYAGWRDSNSEVRERLIADPELYLRARRALPEPEVAPQLDARDELLEQVSRVGFAVRQTRRIAKRRSDALTDLDRGDAVQGLELARSEIQNTIADFRRIDR